MGFIERGEGGGERMNVRRKAKPEHLLGNHAQTQTVIGVNSLFHSRNFLDVEKKRPHNCFD